MLFQYFKRIVTTICYWLWSNLLWVIKVIIIFFFLFFFCFFFLFVIIGVLLTGLYLILKLKQLNKLLITQISRFSFLLCSGSKHLQLATKFYFSFCRNIAYRVNKYYVFTAYREEESRGLLVRVFWELLDLGVRSWVSFFVALCTNSLSRIGLSTLLFRSFLADLVPELFGLVSPLDNELYFSDSSFTSSVSSLSSWRMPSKFLNSFSSLVYSGGGDSVACG